MNGKTYAYLDLAAEPAVGAVLLDPRPAFVFRGDGRALLWANAAGAEFFGESKMGALLARTFSSLNPLVLQVAKLARLLPTDSTRMEILRIGFGTRLTALPAVCRRLNLADGTSAALAIGAVEAHAESLATRAERLADTIAGKDCLVAVLAADGRVLGASGGFAELVPAAKAIDGLIESVNAGAKKLVKRPIPIDGGQRPAGIARIDVRGERVYLLIVGPEEEARETAVATGPGDVFATPRSRAEPAQANAAPAAATAPPTEPAVIGKPDVFSPPPEAGVPLPQPATPPPETSPPPAAAAREADAVKPPSAADPPRIRFFWQMDAEEHFTYLSPELAGAVGPSHAAIIGKDWQTVARRLLLDEEGRVAAALASRASWSDVRVYWPLEVAAERVAIDLAAVPSISRDRGFEGYRGFGVLRLDDRRPDDRRVSLTEPEAIVVAPASLALSEEDVDDAARKIVEGGRHLADRRDAGGRPEEETPSAEAAVPPSPPPPAAARSNVVRLPGTNGPPRPPQPERLSGNEQDAFRRIAEALGVQVPDDMRQKDDRPSGTAKAPAAEKPATVAPKDSPRPPEEPERRTAEFDTRLLDRLPVGLVIFRDRKTLFANRPLLDLLRFETAEAFAKAGGADAIFPDGEADWTRPALAAGDGRLVARRSDGSTVPVEVRLHAVTWAQATALMLSLRERSAARPIPAGETELVAALTAAESRAEELEAILDTATDGVIVIDERGRVGNFNRSAEALFGIEANEVLGTAFTDLLAEESRRGALDYLDGLASNGVASVLNDGREVIGKVPQGGLIPLFMTMGRIGATGKFCAVLRDITHWKNVEEELVAARRAAETANHQKSEFLAKISHEIRTPLNAIIGFSEVMMEERFGSIGNQRYRDYLRDINVSGAHLMSLINDLLDLSKIEAGKLDLNFEAVAVNAAIQECVALMQPQANRERIIIRTSLAAEVPDVVADHRSLRQILLNLLSNAIKFTKAGGQVIVSTALEESGEVVVRIRDTGVGMSEKDLETAMKPFRQVATSGRARDDGTGLGLPLTKALVEANRAAFAIDSVPNQGTLVRITFPTTRVLAG